MVNLSQCVTIISIDVIIYKHPTHIYIYIYIYIQEQQSYEEYSKFSSFTANSPK